MRPKLNLYQQISANKRKTVLILLAFGAFAVLLALGVSSIFELGPAGTILILVAFAALMAIQYSASSAMVLKLSGARAARREEYPFIYHTVEGLAIAAGIPAPKCYIIDSMAPNAFTTGRNPKEGVVAITTGLIGKLNNEEIEGVLAHEIGHIQNFDVRLATIAIAFVGIVAIIGEFVSRGLWLGGFRTRTKSNSRKNDSSGLIAILGLIFVILAPIFSRLLQMALSRRREYTADTTAAWLTRNPMGLANALRKIASDPSPLHQATPSTAALFIVNPFKKASRFAANALLTHPPIEDRIKILEHLAYKY